MTPIPTRRRAPPPTWLIRLSRVRVPREPPSAYYGSGSWARRSPSKDAHRGTTASFDWTLQLMRSRAQPVPSNGREMEPVLRESRPPSGHETDRRDASPWLRGRPPRHGQRRVAQLLSNPCWKVTTIYLTTRCGTARFEARRQRQRQHHRKSGSWTLGPARSGNGGRCSTWLAEPHNVSPFCCAASMPNPSASRKASASDPLAHIRTAATLVRRG